jgi:rod shape-determining protein MreD
MSRNKSQTSVFNTQALLKPDAMLPIPISIAVGTLLIAYPVAPALNIWRPEIMLLIVLYWVMHQPKWCGVWFAFLTGITTDLMLDSHLGLHAFVFVLLTFSARYLTRNRRVLTYTSLWIIASIVVFMDLVLFFLYQRMTGNAVQLWFWSPLLPSILMWPVICFLLKRWKGI